MLINYRFGKYFPDACLNQASKELYCDVEDCGPVDVNLATPLVAEVGIVHLAPSLGNRCVPHDLLGIYLRLDKKYASRIPPSTGVGVNKILERIPKSGPLRWFAASY